MGAGVSLQSYGYDSNIYTIYTYVLFGTYLLYTYTINIIIIYKNHISNFIYYY